MNLLSYSELSCYGSMCFALVVILEGDDLPDGSKSGQLLTGAGFWAQLRAPAIDE